MTIDIHQQQSTDVATTQQSFEGDALVQWAMAADRAYQIATKLANTSFVPQSMKGNAGNITAAILAGNELGLPPMAALRSIDVIQGTPGLRAHAMRGLVQSHGHQVQLIESTSEKCVMRGRRKGDEDWQEVEWTFERARLLGVTERNPQWKKQPQTMLEARSTGNICRLIASDVLHAMPYASEELDGYGQADGAMQVRPVTIRELAPDAAPGEEQPQPEGEPRTELPKDDPWYVPTDAAEDAETLAEYEAQS
ncbi:hypothetical protein ACIRPH_30845 [Nocardiopsis sp. NPDC101807]|uniref:hypothetical protein n=1 Tax=Nocardiopsis sp. NPDC101807 TaxID=3364339 RepID=UPI0038147D00